MPEPEPALLQDRASGWESVTDYSSDFVDEDLERNALGEFRLRVTRNSVPSGSFIRPLTREQACQWCVDRLLPSCLRQSPEKDRARPEPAAPFTNQEIDTIEKLLPAGGWDLRFEEAGEKSTDYYTKFGCRIIINGNAGNAEPNWSVCFNAIVCHTADELFNMCASLDAAHWHRPKLDAVESVFIGWGWRVTKHKDNPRTIQAQREGFKSIEMYLWGNELNFYTYTPDENGEEKTLSLLDGLSAEQMAETIVDAE